jgi:hypothetical protein
MKSKESLEPKESVNGLEYPSFLFCLSFPFYLDDPIPSCMVSACNTLFPPVCKNNWTGQELWKTHKCEYVMEMDLE